MKAEVLVGWAEKVRGEAPPRCWVCKEEAALLLTPRDLDDPQLPTRGEDEGSWYMCCLYSCWGCVRKLTAMLMADPLMPEREADRADEVSSSAVMGRLDDLEHVIDEIGEELDK